MLALPLALTPGFHAGPAPGARAAETPMLTQRKIGSAELANPDFFRVDPGMQPLGRLRLFEP